MNKKSGFTIIEVVVVVVLIAFITTFSYFFLQNWRYRTADTQLKNDITQARNALKNYRNYNSSYPANLNGIFTPSNDVNLSYMLRSDGSYCMTAEHKTVNVVENQYYYVDSRKLGAWEPEQIVMTSTSCSP